MLLNILHQFFFSQNIGEIRMRFCLCGTDHILRLNEDIKMGWELSTIIKVLYRMLCFCFEKCSIACSIPKLLLESYHTSDKQHWQRKDKITQCVFNYGGHHIPFNLERSNAPEFATQDSAADALRRLVQGSEAEAVNDSIYTPKPFREILATGHSDPPKTLLRLVCVCLHVF